MHNCDYCGKEAPVVTMNPEALAARMARSSGRKTNICGECLEKARHDLGELERKQALKENAR